MITRIYNLSTLQSLSEYKYRVSGTVYMPWKNQNDIYFLKEPINKSSAKLVLGVMYNCGKWHGAFLYNEFDSAEEAMMEVDAVLIGWGAVMITEKMLCMI